MGQNIQVQVKTFTGADQNVYRCRLKHTGAGQNVYRCGSKRTGAGQNIYRCRSKHTGAGQNVTGADLWIRKGTGAAQEEKNVTGVDQNVTGAAQVFSKKNI